MKLSDEQTGILRNSLIAQIASAGTIGLPLSTLMLGVKHAGFGRMEEGEVMVHLDYLEIEEMVRVSGNAVAARLKRWFITKQGMRHAEENGLV